MKEYPYSPTAEFFDFYKDGDSDNVIDGGEARIVIQFSEDSWGTYDIKYKRSGLFWYTGTNPMSGEIAKVISDIIIDTIMSKDQREGSARVVGITPTVE